MFTAMFKASYLPVAVLSALSGTLLAFAQGAPQTGGQTSTQTGAQTGAQTGGAAPEARERIITITYDGGTRNSPDLRYGPYVYAHPNPEGIVAEVSNLLIYTQRGELRAPQGVLIADAEGRREASFTGGVRVERGRLTATGQRLEYSEATGRGVMPEQPDIVIEPAEADDDVVNITTREVTFDVDTDTSVSRGDVALTNGPQSAAAQELTYEEGRDLAVLSAGQGQVTVRREDEDGSVLTITADEVRVLTASDVLLASGDVTIVDGDTTTTGDTVFYDDTASRAEVIGNPAVSEDAAFGTIVRGGRLEQRTDIDSVQALSNPEPSFDAAQFALSSEAPAAP